MIYLHTSMLLVIKNGKLGRENDLPAYTDVDGKQKWHINGKLGRDNDLPAVIDNGMQRWYVNGELHRDNNKPDFTLLFQSSADLK